MAGGMLAQNVIVALVVAWSALYIVKSRFPAQVRRARGWLAIRLIDAGPAWSRRLGVRLAPVQSSSGGACGGCDGCGPTD